MSDQNHFIQMSMIEKNIKSDKFYVLFSLLQLNLRAFQQPKSFRGHSPTSW